MGDLQRSCQGARALTRKKTCGVVMCVLGEGGPFGRARPGRIELQAG